MTTNTDNSPGIVVSGSAGILDTLSALGRYAVVIAAAVPLLLNLLGSHNFMGLVDYFRGDDGKSLIGALIALGTLLWGLYKTSKRGTQIAAVASSTKVPDDVATTK